MRIRIAPIVEGHGEDQAVRTLLRRIWQELLGAEHAEVSKPIRGKRYSLVKEEELSRAINLALFKLNAAEDQTTPALILVLLDADDALPCQLGPQLSAIAKKCRSDADVACVVANIAYETWFVAAAESLGDYLRLIEGEKVPDQPEQARCGKGWVKKRFIGQNYSETVDQPRLTAKWTWRIAANDRLHSTSFVESWKSASVELGNFLVPCR